MRESLALLFVLGLSCPSDAATLTFSDGICAYRVAFDEAKMPARRLKATIAYLQDDAPLVNAPVLAEPGDVATASLAKVEADCAVRRHRLEQADFIAFPGLEDLRRRQIAELDDACALTAAEISAAKGDVKALRGYAPAASTCGRFADALETADATLPARYDDLLAELCRTSTERNICIDHFQKAGEGPGKLTRMRLNILTEGWARCAGETMLLNKETGPSATETGSDRLKRQIRTALMKRLKPKALSCAQ